MKLLSVKKKGVFISAAFIIIFIFFASAVWPRQSFAQTRKIKNLPKNLQNEITLSAGVGIDNSFFPNHLNPVDVTVNNGTAGNFEGEILVEAAGNFYRITNVLVGPRSSKKYSVFAKFASYTYSIKVSIINSANIVIFDEKISVTSNQLKDYYILSVSETPSYVSSLRTLSLPEKRKEAYGYDAYGYGGSSGYNSSENSKVVVHNITAAEMFSNFACYEPYSLVIINAIDVSALNKEQTKAVIEYAGAGGAIMISYGGFVSRLAASELASILPVTIKGSEVFNGPDFYRYAASQNINGALSEKFEGVNIPLSVAEVKEGAMATLNLTAPDGRIVPLIAHSRFGSGIVYYTAFDIAQIDIGRIDYLKDNINGILKQGEDNKDFKMSGISSSFVKFSEKFSQFVTEPPSAYIVLLLLITFTLLIGPLFYFYIRNRVTMVRLVIVPMAISLLFFVIFNCFDIEFMLNSPSVAELALRIADNETMKSQLISSVAILMPPMSGGDYSIDMNEATLMGTAKDYYGNRESEIIINEDRIKLIHPQMDYRFSKYAVVKQTGLNGRFRVDYGAEAAGSVEKATKKNKPVNAFKTIDGELQSYINAAALNKKAKKLNSIVNNTDLDISDCRVYYAGRVFSFDRLAPGAKSSPVKDFSCDPNSIDDHFYTICDSITAEMPPSLRKGGSGYSYSGEGFLKTAAVYIAKNSAKSPVIVGYVRGGGAMGEAVKTSGCSLNELGTIAIIKL